MKTPSGISLSHAGAQPKKKAPKKAPKKAKTVGKKAAASAGFDADSLFVHSGDSFMYKSEDYYSWNA